jgi:hypothetical protein
MTPPHSVVRDRVKPRRHRCRSRLLPRPPSPPGLDAIGNLAPDHLAPDHLAPRCRASGLASLGGCSRLPAARATTPT